MTTNKSDHVLNTKFQIKQLMWQMYAKLNDNSKYDLYIPWQYVCEEVNLQIFKKKHMISLCAPYVFHFKTICLFVSSILNDYRYQATFWMTIKNMYHQCSFT